MIEEKLIGAACIRPEEGHSQPAAQAMAIGRRLMQALESESNKEEATQLAVVEQLIQNLDPVQRRNVQQMLETLGTKLWDTETDVAVSGNFPALKVERDQHGDMKTIICRLPGKTAPQSKIIELELGGPNLAMAEGMNLFRLQTGEPIIIRFSDSAGRKVINEIVAPFGCTQASGIR